MKKAFLLLLVCVFVVGQIAYAEEVILPTELHFDPVTKIVTATITHPTADGKTNYVEKVVVSINGKRVITQEISLQNNTKVQSVSFRVPDADMGDVVTIEATCNIKGCKAAFLQVR